MVRLCREAVGDEMTLMADVVCMARLEKAKDGHVKKKIYFLSKHLCQLKTLMVK